MKFTFFFIFFFLFFNIEGNSAKAENIKLQGCYNETRTSYDKPQFNCGIKTASRLGCGTHKFTDSLGAL